MSPQMQGYLFAGLAIVCWGLWGFFSKIATTHNHGLTVSFVNSVVLGLAAPALFIAARGVKPVMDFSAAALTPAVLSATAALCGGIVYMMALQKAPATVVVPMTAAYPALTSILAVIFLQETMDAKQIAGMVLVMGGCALLGLPK